MLKIYNTLTRKKEIFKPIRKVVGLYTCGPTVYNYLHIGNLRTFIFEDILKRVLFYNGFKVKHVMNITDVGHLTSDTDTGEDKVEKAAQEQKKSAWKIIKFYTNIFKEDLKKLNILFPNVWCKATSNIKEQINLIKKLEVKGFTYKTEDGIYFDTSKLKDYGKLARLKKEKLKVGIRVEFVKGKKNVTDFALWKFSPKNSKRQMEWKSPWGIGFPGWHIECSAMSMKYLSEHFDIHCGGIDHIPIHHTNEIAQSEAASGKKFVNYWLHAEFLILDKRKMAKSAGTFIRLRDLTNKKFDPLAFRYLCLTSRYKSQLNFSWQALKSAQNSFMSLKNRIFEIKRNLKIKKEKKSNRSKDFNKYKNRFLESVNNDLDMPKALTVMWALIKDDSIINKEKYNLLLDFDKVLGLNLESIKEEKISKEIKLLIKKREKARAEKNYRLADKIRAELKSKGVVLEDTEKGIKWKFIK